MMSLFLAMLNHMNLMHKKMHPLKCAFEFGFELHHSEIFYFGRVPAGQAFRYNLFCGKKAAEKDFHFNPSRDLPFFFNFTNQLKLSIQIKTIQIHDFYPHFNKVVDKFFFVIILCIQFGISTQNCI